MLSFLVVRVAFRRNNPARVSISPSMPTPLIARQLRGNGEATVFPHEPNSIYLFITAVSSNTDRYSREDAHVGATIWSDPVEKREQKIAVEMR